MLASRSDPKVKNREIERKGDHLDYSSKIAKQRVAERRSNNVPHISFVLSNTAPLFLRPTSHCFPSLYSKLSLHSRTLLRNGSSVISGRNRFQIHANSGDSDADTNQSTSTSLLSFLCPLLKLFSAGDPSQERNFSLEVATSSLSTLARFPWGSRSLSKNLDSQEITTLDPPMRLQLFEFEACPFCRRVREAMTELDLSAEVYPCPKGSIRHRELVNRSGGKEQFPFLIDPNTGISMYESGKL
ncbi:hypothetical protein M0R45_026991 [Rubus argutus]|uniref:GST N-terminal domain-containing protein n=1 Tax=Rubus argutus TaxID=59490 RepID=A0AAW1X1U6_RUBAR